MKKRWLQKWLAPAHGQSLVEMAITAPILIFMLIGVFEVGWALRGYLVLTNVNREITRFAVRPGYLDFSTKDSVITSYNRIYDWVTTANSGELPLNFSEEITDGNATLIVAHLVVDTGLPCEDMTGCNCDSLSSPFTDDDLIIHPDIPNYAYQAMTFPPVTSTRPIPPSRIDYADLVANSLIPENNKFNCEIIKKGGVASANNLIITQMFFEQPQLFGFPLISNPLTDPVPMYAHTSMRLSTAARSSGTEAGSLVENISTIGPVCAAMPIIIKDTQLGSNPQAGVTELDILDGNEGGDWGWLTWNPAEDDENYLEKELKYPQLSLNDFTDPGEPDDHYLNIGDDVTSLNGLNDSTDVRSALEGLRGQTIIIPVWSPSVSPGFRNISNPSPPPANVGVYRITNFIKVEIKNVPDADLHNNLSSQKKIVAIYQGPVEEGCESVAVATPPPGSTPTATATPDAAATAAAEQTATAAAAQANATATVAAAATAQANATATQVAAQTATAQAANTNATATAQAQATATAQAQATATAVAATATANANATATSVAATATAQAPVLTTIASHDLEDNSSSGGSGWSGSSWSFNNSAGITNNGSPIGNRHLRMRNATAQATRAVDMTGVTGARLQFQWKASGFESSDTATIQISTNGGSNWTTIMTVNNGQDDNTYHAADLDISSYTMNSNFQIRFQMNGNADNDIFYIDNVAIVGYR